MQVAELITKCKPMAEPPALMAGLISADEGLLDYQSTVAVPMLDFHSGKVSCVVLVDGVHKFRIAAGRTKQCGFLIGCSDKKSSEEFKRFFGCNDAIFCTDLITAFALNKATNLPVVFSLDPASFKFSGAGMAYIKQMSYDSLSAAYRFFGDVDYYYPTGQIEYDHGVKWITAEQAQNMLIDEEGFIN